MIYKEKFNFIT